MYSIKYTYIFIYIIKIKKNTFEKVVYLFIFYQKNYPTHNET
jgi:hypothetical protein